MAKFKVGDVVVCVNAGSFNELVEGKEYVVKYCDDNGSSSRLGVLVKGPEWSVTRFEIVSPKQSLKELYNIEADKLHEQAAKVDSAWRLLQAESVSLQASRQKAIEDKRLQVDILLDDLERAQFSFDKATIELDEMLRNEPF